MRAGVAAARSRPHPHPRNRLKTSRLPREPLRAALAENICLLMGRFWLQPQKGASPYRARWARAHDALPPDVWRNRDGIPGEFRGNSGGGGSRCQTSVFSHHRPQALFFPSMPRWHDATMPFLLRARLRLAAKRGCCARARLIVFERPPGRSNPARSSRHDASMP